MEWRACPVCREPFLTDRATQRYCAPRCKRRMAARARTRPSRATPRTAGTCAECGAVFLGGQAGRRFCSARCRNTAHCRRAYRARRARGWRKVGGRVWTLEAVA